MSKLENKKLLQNIKNTHCCCVCGEHDPTCLEFHHIDKNSKKFSISNSLSKVELKELIKELNKTCLLCANCHKKLHAGKLFISKRYLYKNKIKI